MDNVPSRYIARRVIFFSFPGAAGIRDNFMRAKKQFISLKSLGSFRHVSSVYIQGPPYNYYYYYYIRWTTRENAQTDWLARVACCCSCMRVVRTCYNIHPADRYEQKQEGRPDNASFSIFSSPITSSFSSSSLRSSASSLRGPASAFSRNLRGYDRRSWSPKAKPVRQASA